MQPKKAGRMKRCMHLEISRAKEQTRHAQNRCTGLYTPNTTSLPPILPQFSLLEESSLITGRVRHALKDVDRDVLKEVPLFFFCWFAKSRFHMHGPPRAVTKCRRRHSGGDDRRGERARGHKGGVSRRADAGGTESEPRPGSERGERGARCCLAARGRTRA